MFESFGALGLFEQIIWVVAIVSSIVFAIKAVLMFLGIGVSEALDGIDAVDAVNASDATDLAEIADSGLQFFTLHGILAFLSIGSWTCLLTLSASSSYILSILAGIVAGGIMMVICAFVTRALMNLEESGNVDMKNAIGKIGEVYLRIPPMDDGDGKVNLVINEKLTPYLAVSQDKVPIETGAKVRVVGLKDDGTLIVQREDEELN